MKITRWFEREFKFGQVPGMLPFYLERLRYTAFRIEEKVKGIPDAILSGKRDAKWSIKENIGHLAEVDEIAMKRIDEMLTGAALLSPAVFEPRNDYNKMPVAEVIQLFKTNRNANLKIYDSLSESDLKKSSLHPRLEVMMNPVDLAMFDADHDDHHLVTINEILKLLSK